MNDNDRSASPARPPTYAVELALHLSPGMPWERTVIERAWTSRTPIEWLYHVAETLRPGEWAEIVWSGTPAECLARSGQ